ncbi:MAG TPA: hypothetical protein VGR62_22895 [Candidatus Binatia bacterium]|jgi:hypothetical protein|nr:hypothetical protein [Candidatus Binatia bacterium]
MAWWVRLVAVAVLLGVATDASAGRAQACRRTCRDVIASECGERLGLARPDRVCRKALLRQCRRDGVGVCTYPNVVGGWRYDVAECRQQCGDDAEESCSTRSIFFTFLQFGTRLQENERSMTGWFVDHATFEVDAANVLGDTSRLRGTVVASNRITNVTYDVVVETAEDGTCHRSQVGELVH